MVNLQKYQNKKIAIYGMGLTGRSAAKTLKKLGAEIFCWDDNKKTRKKIKNLKFPLNKFWLNKNFVDNIVRAIFYFEINSTNIFTNNSQSKHY